jgi:hypothetical protein
MIFPPLMENHSVKLWKEIIYLSHIFMEIVFTSMHF